MKGRPHDPQIVEPGPTPPNAERHGLWRILTISLGAAVIALAVLYFVFT